METLQLKKFENDKLNSMSKVFGGDPCGTTWKSLQTDKEGTDHYFDDNDNGRLDSGDTVFLDNGQVITKA